MDDFEDDLEDFSGKHKKASSPFKKDDKKDLWDLPRD